MRRIIRAFGVQMLNYIVKLMLSDRKQQLKSASTPRERGLQGRAHTEV